MQNDFGTKYECYKCNCKFYDLKKPKAICPKCSTDQSSTPKKRQVGTLLEDIVKNKVTPLKVAPQELLSEKLEAAPEIIESPDALDPPLQDEV